MYVMWKKKSSQVKEYGCYETERTCVLCEVKKKAISKNVLKPVMQ